MTASSLTPMLTVKSAVPAIEFYREAFDAVERARFTAPTGHVVAELAIDGLRFFVVDENPAAFTPTRSHWTGRRCASTSSWMTRMPPQLRRSAPGRARSFQSPISPTAFGKDESPILTVITG